MRHCIAELVKLIFGKRQVESDERYYGSERIQERKFAEPEEGYTLFLSSKEIIMKTYKYKLLFAGMIVVVLFMCGVIQEQVQKARWESIETDFRENQIVFEDICELLPVGEYYIITRENYDTGVDALNIVFSELGYKEIYIDSLGNVFFNKFEEGINFRGLVYLNNASYVIGLPKTESRILSGTVKWAVHYSHGL